MEQLEGRLLLNGSVDITLDKAMDQFGFQAETVQVYEDKASWGAIFDTGASLVSFSAADQVLMDPFGGGNGIPIKVPGGAQAEGIGGMLTGDVSQPGTVLVDGIQTSVLTADIFGEGNGLFLDQIQGQGTVVSAAAADQLVGNDRLNLEDSVYAGYQLVFTSTSPGSSLNLGESRTITAYDGDTRAFTFSSGFPQTPVSGDAFHIVADQAVTAGPLPARDQFTGTPVAGDPDGLSDSDGYYVGRYVLFTSGPLDGDSQLITGYDGATHTFQSALPFSQRPQVGDTFDIIVGTGSSAVMPGVQVFVGTPEGSELLSTISGTPMLNPTSPVPAGGKVPNGVAGPQPLHPNGLAVDVNPQGMLLDLGDLLGDLFPDGLFDGITLPIPSVQFREPGTELERSESFQDESAVAATPSPTAHQFAGGSELPDDPEHPELFHDFYAGFQLRFLSGSLNGETREVSAYDSTTRTFACTTPFSQTPAAGDLFELVRISTDPVTLGLSFVEFDNHLDPGDIMTVSYNPVSEHVRLARSLATLDNQCFLFDTGAQLSTISVAQAQALGLDLSAPEFTTSVQGAGGTVAGLPGYTLDELSIPTLEGGRLTFHDAPVFVLDITEQIQGILGMNLFNNAAEFLYDPYDPVHGQPTLQATFFEQRAEVVVQIDTTGLEPLEAALLQSLVDVMPVAFGTAVGLRDISLPGFGVGIDLDLTPQNGVVTEENGTTMVTVPPGTEITFTTEVRYSAESYDSFQLDFAASDSALHLRGWTTGTNWTGIDTTLAFPGDSAVSGQGSAQWSSTLGTFVVDAPAAPGDYLLTADDALDHTAFLLTGVADPLAIRDFGQMIIRVQETPTLAIGDATLVEGANGTVADLEFTVTLTGVASGTVSVDYATADGLAQAAGGDYASRSGTLQFAPGDTQKTITVPVSGDSAPEADENFFVNLSHATIPTGPLVLTPASDVTGVLGGFFFDQLEPADAIELRADDTHAFAMEFALGDIPAGTTIASATLTVYEKVDSQSSPRGVWTYGAIGGATLENPFNTLVTNQVGALGNGSVDTASIDVTSYIQSLILSGYGFAGFYIESGADQYYIHSSEAADPANRPKLTIDYSAGPTTVDIADGQGRALIRNDDTELSISDRGQTEGDGGQTAAAFVIQLSQPSALEVAVSYATADGTASAGSDYEPAQGTVAFAPGETAKAISIPILGDGQVEPDETFFVNLTNPRHVTVAAGHEKGTGTITDDDTPALTVELVSASISEAAGQTRATVARNTATTEALTVTLTSSDTSEATVPDQVTIPAGAQSVEFTVTAADDHLVDGTQRATITAAATGFRQGTTTVEVTDDDAPALTVELVSASISEPAGQTRGTVARNTATTEALTVTLTSSDTSEATVPDQVTIPAGAQSVEFTVTAADDHLVDGTQRATITAAATGFSQGTTTVEVADDDAPALTVELASALISEPAGQTRGTVARNTATTEALTVTLTSSDTSEATVPEQVTIPAGAQSVEFAVTAVDDHLVDGTQRATITAAATGFRQGTTTVEVTDQDGDHDGVSTTVEDGAANGGDGNHDGVPDGQQGNVTSLPNAVDASYVTLAAPDGMALENVRTSSNPPPGDVPQTTTFPIGFLDYTVTDASVGFATTVVISWESNVTLNSYLKYGPTPDDSTPHWYPFMYDGTTGAKIYSDRIEVHLVDGLRGDDDLTANGRIVDPGAPGTNEHPWQNPVLRVNVNNDSIVSPLDVLLVINEINVRGSRTLPAVPANGEALPPFWDVSGDDHISPHDVLLVINYLNGAGASRQGMAVGQAAAIRPTGVGEGESASSNREPQGGTPLGDPFLGPDSIRQAPGISDQPVYCNPALIFARCGSAALVAAPPSTAHGHRSTLEQQTRAESVTDDLFAQLDSAPLERVLRLAV